MDSSAVEHYTVTVEKKETIAPLSNDDQVTKAGALNRQLLYVLAEDSKSRNNSIGTLQEANNNAACMAFTAIVY